jgi:hypothetical protein
MMIEPNEPPTVPDDFEEPWMSMEEDIEGTDVEVDNVEETA